MAADNFVQVLTGNTWRACGVWRGRGSSRQWVQLYSGQVEDPRFKRDALLWYVRFPKVVWKRALKRCTTGSVGTTTGCDSQPEQLPAAGRGWRL